MRLLHSATTLAAPYGGSLTQLLVNPATARELKLAALDFPSLDLTARELCDLELLATGAFSPLKTFMGRADYESVCAHSRLADGRLWPLPIVLEAPAKLAQSLTAGARVALRDVEGALIAVLTVAEIFERDRSREAEQLYGAPAGNHPDAAFLQQRQEYVCLSGRLEVVELPMHHDFTALRHTPSSMRARFAQTGTTSVIGYAPRHLLHRTHIDFSRRAAQSRSATLLVLAAAGRRYLEEPSHYLRTRALVAALENYPADGAQLNVLPLSPRQAGARAVMLKAIVARNFGCSYMIVEHDHADIGDGANAESHYGQYTTIETLQRHAAELGVEPIPFRNLVREEDRPEHFLSRRGARHVDSETARWFSYPRVLHEFQRPAADSGARGFTVFFTGLSGAGKSTIARILQARLMESGERQLSMFDGDVVRKHLSSELGFSREHRDLNVMRLGYVASIVTQHRGIAICAPIAPYAATRAQVRAMVEAQGTFVEVYVATSLATCEARDRKGLYARARQGLIPQFTGISDPYEPPTAAEIVIDTDKVSAVDAAQGIIDYLVNEGLLTPLTPVRGNLGAGTAAPVWADLAPLASDIQDGINR